MIIFDLFRCYIIPCLSDQNGLKNLKCVCSEFNNYIKVNYPFSNKTILNSIIPYLSSVNNLCKLKCLCKKTNVYIKCHPKILLCEHCGYNRFSISINNNMCFVKDCMVTSFFHPAKVYTFKNKFF